MAKVTGIGGVFFKARDPAGLGAWYETHLGINPVPTDYETPCWRAGGGPAVFAPFPAETEYFSRPEQQWMINFRVADLDAMLADLAAAGIKAEVVDPDPQPNGRFARLYDPEGNPIELWEPSGHSRDMEESS